LHLIAAGKKDQHCDKEHERDSFFESPWQTEGHGANEEVGRRDGYGEDNGTEQVHEDDKLR